MLSNAPVPVPGVEAAGSEQGVTLGQVPDLAVLVDPPLPLPLLPRLLALLPPGSTSARLLQGLCTGQPLRLEVPCDVLVGHTVTYPSSAPVTPYGKGPFPDTRWRIIPPQTHTRAVPQSPPPSARSTPGTCARTHTCGPVGRQLRGGRQGEDTQPLVWAQDTLWTGRAPLPDALAGAGD